jgi:hypothetical protein
MPCLSTRGAYRRRGPAVTSSTAGANQPVGLAVVRSHLVLRDGTRSRWLQCGGSFGRFTFVPELQDIDWVPGDGVGVTLDVSLPAQEQRKFFDLIRQMARMGWVTSKGCWSIQQVTAVWHGFGADTLIEVLCGWSRRYHRLETHHTEELCHSDECENGFYMLVAQLSPEKWRLVWRFELSFPGPGRPHSIPVCAESCALTSGSATRSIPDFEVKNPGRGDVRLQRRSCRS